MRTSLILLSVAALIGCAHRPDPATVFGEAYAIDAVTLEGVTVFSKATVLEHLYLGETHWAPFTPDYHFDEATLPVDIARLEALYAAHGYHHARVIDARVDRDDEAKEVALTLIVEEGPPTLLDAVRFRWAEDTTLDPAARRHVEGLAALKRGAPFVIADLNSTIGILRVALQAWGYPLAQVTADAEVNPGAREARADVRLDPGPYARVRRVVIDGLAAVPEDLVQVELGFARGEGFSPNVSHAVEQVAKGMDIFRWVTVRPGEEVIDGEVDLRLRVSESDPQSLSLGARATFEAARWEQQLVGRYTHTNLLGRLLRLDLDLIAGWAELPDGIDRDAHGPVLQITPTFRKKGWLETYLQWLLRPSYEVDIQPGYKYHAPAAELGVARWFGRRLLSQASYTTRFVDFFDVADDLDGTTSQLGLDFRDPYLLSYLSFALDASFADHLVEPTNGALIGVVYELAGGALGGDFDYHKLTATWRSYWRPWSRLQTAARFSGGVIIGHGDSPEAPIDRRYYLGGANSVRAWGSRQLSPRLQECASGASAENVEGVGACADSDIPIGGATMVQGTVEARLRAAGPVWLVGFLDVGDVQAEELTWARDEWNYTAGPGLRLESPLGIIRLDVGFRLNDPGVYTDAPTWGMHFGFGESF